MAFSLNRVQPHHRRVPMGDTRGRWDGPHVATFSSGRAAGFDANPLRGKRGALKVVLKNDGTKGSEDSTGVV